MVDNTNAVWYRDRGLRRMAVHVGVLYLCVFTFGVSPLGSITKNDRHPEL